MNKTKGMNGITLIALVITIIVMLILVGITLNVVLNGNLIGNAQDATDKQAMERDKELLYTAALGCMKNGIVKFDGEDGLDNNLPYGFEGEDGEYERDNRIYTVNKNGSVDYNGKYISQYISKKDLNLEPEVSLIEEKDLTGDIKKATKKGKISAVLEETINGEDIIAVIPTGFTISTIQGENKISEGLVVRDSEQNEFVWIPVPNISDMAVPQEEGSSDYRGVLYNWYVDSTGQTTYSWSSTSTGKREPANLTGTTAINGESVAYDSQEAFTEYGGGTWTETMYQTEFNEMVQSVEKYKGFYVGRYETGGFNTNRIVIKSGEGDNSINNVNWYKAYKMQKEYADGKETIGSTMIWGCQWDQVMKFVDDKKDGAGNTFNVTTKSTARHTGELAPTGNNINDKVQNIFDLEGNLHEMTLEADTTNWPRRDYRGYEYRASEIAACRLTNYPNSAHNSILGSRATLYIK